MSFIQFESATEKERIRQELKEVQAELLKRAEAKAKHRDEQEVKKQLRGDDQWILPSVSKKIDKLSSSDKSKKKSKKSKKSSKKSKKEKKEKRKRKKKANSSSSSGEESASSSEERISKRKHKRKHFSDASSSSSSESDSDSGNEWIEKSDAAAEKQSETVPLQREDWLGGMLIPTYLKSAETKSKPKDERRHIDSYDPGKSTRELNPYWKDGGTGMPTFQKPNYDSDDDENDRYRSRPSRSQTQSTHTASARQSNWRKKTESATSDSHRKSEQSSRSPKPRSNQRRKSSDSSSSQSSHSSRSPSPDLKSHSAKSEAVANDRTNQSSRGDFLTDQQMNELGAKLVKAEIMGNEELAKELKDKLERGRQYRSEHKEEVLAQAADRRANPGFAKRDAMEEENVLLTATNSKGMSRPLAQARNESDLWGGRAGKKAKKQKPVETHAAGERLRYFADDDKYNLKQMFEREKYETAADQDIEFAKIAAKHKNPNDDLEDIFTDKVRKKVDEQDSLKEERDRAIHEHQQMAKALETCDKCFDSPKHEKQLMVAMGNNVYLSLPWHEGLQTGHCIIAPVAHVPCTTALDEDVWAEVRDFMKAIVRMFAARKQDVIFFEIARNLHRRPHMAIHCVASKEFELAPFYFKKAIQEAEGDWATNKQLISLKDRDVRRAIPKGLPYFWVNFNMDSGFAHVIENQDRFPSNFAQEVIGGLLNLDARLWRRPRKLTNPIPKVKQFADWWKPYDATK